MKNKVETNQSHSLGDSPRMIHLRRETEVVHYRSYLIGGGNPIALESMLKCRTTDLAEAGEQLHRLARAGCDLCRVAVQNSGDAAVLPDLVALSPIPLMADIHFRADLAEKALAAGLPVRLNPGNLSDSGAVSAIAHESQRLGLPLRIGVNSGSLAKNILEKYSHQITAAGMVESLLELEEVCRKAGCKHIIASLKATSIPLTLVANTTYAQETRTPLHIGITEAGFGEMGLINSSVGIGILLSYGLGDTVRVSLTGDPVQEIVAGRMILNSLGMGKPMVRLLSCPTCGRLRMPVEKIARALWDEVHDWQQDLTMAVMGCEVNGPGEARDADLGVAGTADGAIIFVKGEKIKRVGKNTIVKEVIKAARELLNK